LAVKLSGGEAPDNESFNKVMALGHGLPGAGKTGFALSFPSPLFIFNLDRPMGHLLKMLPKTHEVTYEAVSVIDVDVPTPAMAMGVLRKFDALMKDAFANGGNGTVIVDGWDLFWDMVKIGKVPGLGENDLPKEYAPANAYMNNWLSRLGKSNLNVCFTTISSKVWTGAKTEVDRMRADGFKHKDRWLTHEVYLFSPEDRRTPAEVPSGGKADVPGSLGQTHRGIITLSKLRERLINQVVPNLNYGLLYKMTFGESYPEPARLWSPSAAAVAASKEEDATT
jgi:hypothetical protein